MRRLDLRLKKLSDKHIGKYYSDIIETHRLTEKKFREILTIIVPHVNYGRYLQECLDSLTSSTLKNFKILVIESGSNGENLEIVKQIEKFNKDERIEFIYDSRHKIGYNRNLGASLADSPFIVSFDPDDTVESTYFELATFLLVARQLDVVGSAARVFGNEEGIWKLPAIVSVNDLSIQNVCPSHSVFTKSVWEQVRGFTDVTHDGRLIFEDWKFWHRVSVFGGRIRNISAPLINLRIHGANMSRQPNLLPTQTQSKEIQTANIDVKLTLYKELPIVLRNSLNPPVNQEQINHLAKLSNRSSSLRSYSANVLVFLPWLDQAGATKVFDKISRELLRSDINFIVCLTEPHPATASRIEVPFEVWDLPKLVDKDLWVSFINYLIIAKSVSAIWQIGSSWLYQNLEKLNDLPEILVDSLFSPESTHIEQNIRSSAYISNVMVESKYMVETYQKKGGKKPIAIAPNGVEIPEPQLDLYRSIDLLYVGRMNAEKNPLAFIHLVQRIQVMRPNMSLNAVMIGDGPLLNELKKISFQESIKISFLGFDPNPKLYMSLAKLTVITSTPIDGRPNVVLESLSTGTPVCAFAVGDIPNIIEDGRNGFLVKHGDLNAMIEKILSYLESESQHKSFSVESLKDAHEKHDWKLAIEEYSKVFSS
jgi:glycosyltransferase involved in cell wall biosynthesis